MATVRKPAAGGGAGYVSVEALQEQQDAYFSELLSYSLERLSKEPELLRVDQEQIKRSIQECAVSKYRAFVDTARCLSAVATEMEDIQTSLDSLESDLPALSSTCEGFQAEARRILANRTASKQLYASHSTVLELLEVPGLMDTCVRNGNYDEALDLRAFVAKLAYMHGDLRVVQLLREEVARVNAVMLQQLMAKLRANIQLPECLRVIGYLRRLAAFPEQELRLRFLQSRERWLDEQIADLQSEALGSAYDHLKRLTDLNRLHLFDIVMQFRAIFSDDAASGASGGGGFGSAGAYGGAGGNGAEADGGILYSWAHHRVCLYVDTIRQQLPRISEGGNLMSVLEHCMYCGMSLGRMGLDFRALLPPMFEAAVMCITRKAVASSVESFATSLDLHKWVALPGSTSAARDRRSAAAAAAAAVDTTGGLSSRKSSAGSGLGNGGGADGDECGPPSGLMEYPPLAVLANGLLAAFNELRHCAPLSVRHQVAALLQEALGQVTSKLISYGVTRAMEDEHSSSSTGAHPSSTSSSSAAAASKGGPSEQQALYSAACRAFVDTLVPYTASCFGRVYPGSLGALDVPRVTQPLKEAMRQWDALLLRSGDMEPGVVDMAPSGSSLVTRRSSATTASLANAAAPTTAAAGVRAAGPPAVPPPTAAAAVLVAQPTPTVTVPTAVSVPPPAATPTPGAPGTSDAGQG